MLIAAGVFVAIAGTLIATAIVAWLDAETVFQQVVASNLGVCGVMLLLLVVLLVLTDRILKAIRAGQFTYSAEQQQHQPQPMPVQPAPMVAPQAQAAMPPQHPMHPAQPVQPGAQTASTTAPRAGRRPR